MTPNWPPLNLFRHSPMSFCLFDPSSTSQSSFQIHPLRISSTTLVSLKSVSFLPVIVSRQWRRRETFFLPDHFLYLSKLSLLFPLSLQLSIFLDIIWPLPICYLLWSLFAGHASHFFLMSFIFSEMQESALALTPLLPRDWFFFCLFFCFPVLWIFRSTLLVGMVSNQSYFFLFQNLHADFNLFS